MRKIDTEESREKKKSNKSIKGFGNKLDGKEV